MVSFFFPCSSLLLFNTCWLLLFYEQRSKEGRRRKELLLSWDSCKMSSHFLGLTKVSSRCFHVFLGSLLAGSCNISRCHSFGDRPNSPFRSGSPEAPSKLPFSLGIPVYPPLTSQASSEQDLKWL